MNRKVLGLLVMALLTAFSAGAQRSANAIARGAPSSTSIASVGSGELPQGPAASWVSSPDEPRQADDSQAPPRPSQAPRAAHEAPNPPEELQEPDAPAPPRPGRVPRPAIRYAEREEEINTRVLARAAAKEERGRHGEEQYYERGKRALDQQQWDRAIERFDEVIQLGGGHADGALYWKAYAQNKLGQQAAALATLEGLRKSHSDSRWLNDAKALEVEVRQSTGQKVSPESVSDEDLKLMAINGLMNSDPEHALPMLEKFLQGNQPIRLKERALFVLTQSRSPQAREIVGRIAKGGSNPDLQLTAVKYLGLFGGQESRQVLADVYASSTDLELKRGVLRSFMLAGDRGRVLAAAQTEKVPELRLDAIQQLGLMGGQAELWQLYQQESSVSVKEKILHSMFLGGNAEKLVEVARTEKDPALRRAAVHSLGLMGKKSGDTLAPLYTGEQDKDIRKDIIGALFLQGNAHALVEIARKETDPELKKQAVSRLSLMHSKEGADYLMELLNK